MGVPVVYKFCAAKHVAGNLRECRLKVSEKHELNDPFEIRFLGAEVSMERAREHFRSKEGWARTVRALREKGRWDAELLEKSGTLPKDLVERLARQFVEKSQHLQEFMSGELDKALVMSTCGRNDHVLLWSHYADRHRGAALGLDYSWAKEPLMEVGYPDTNEIPILDVLGLDDFEQARRVLRTKGRVWRYEQEYRAIWDRSQAFKDSGFWFVRMKPTTVREVVLGCCISETDRKNIMEALDADHYRDVAVFGARRSESHYRLEITRR